MGPKAHSAIMFFNSVTRAMGTNAVSEFSRRAPQEDSLPRQWFPQPRLRRDRCATKITQVDSHAIQAAGPRGCGRGDHGGEQGG